MSSFASLNSMLSATRPPPPSPWPAPLSPASSGNSIFTLRDLARREAGPPSPSFDATRRDLEEAAASAGQATHIQMLDGIEGAAARAYFGELMSFNPQAASPGPAASSIPPPTPSTRSSRLPIPCSPTNSWACSKAPGLDPYIGFLHQLDYGRPSLALDLVEAFRAPVADRFVLAAINQGFFGQEDFTRQHGRDGLFLRHRLLQALLRRIRKMDAPDAPEPSRVPPHAPRRGGVARPATSATNSPWTPADFETVGPDREPDPPKEETPCNTSSATTSPDDHRRNRLSEALKDFGARIQESVFLADLDDELARKMRERIEALIEPHLDSVHLFVLCSSCTRRAQSLGVARIPPEEEFYIL